MGPPKNILAFDTALGGCSVGVRNSVGQSAVRHVETMREQAQILVPLIEDVLKEAQVEYADLDLIVSTIGPGSFTGLRIGLSTARSLALALDRPAVGVNTLDLMAAHYDTDKPLLVMLETKRKDFYACCYDVQGEPLGNPFAAEISEILEQAPKGAFSVGGDCLVRFREEVKAVGLSQNFELLEEVRLSDPLKLIEVGQRKFESSKTVENLEPLYLRGADVSQPKNPLRKMRKDV
ncbi:MAG: tRNA (adenosine(37)-N6)-threonylcarbamoyltransferase complex dimerization subunit type 1 TsaB [Alphaproteobacteria bacterium]|nr:tRNA (adenosine(37)-N6)-threonylcarbamoyltransferase complex dimerization subunit type 1 TsaB [Alphaproteobacteria bacterium]